MTLEERIARLESSVFGEAWKQPPNNPHSWEDVYLYDGHYPDGKQCRKCGIFKTSTTSTECES